MPPGVSEVGTVYIGNRRTDIDPIAAYEKFLLAIRLFNLL